MLSSAAALADNGISYSYIQAIYQEVEIDIGEGFDADGDGYGVGGSVEINDNWFVFAGYAASEFESVVDLDQLEAGGGYHAPLSEKTDWYATLAYVSAEVSASGFGSADDSGVGVALGVRSMVSPSLELYASASYADLGDGADGSGFGVGLWYTVSGNIALGIGAGFGDDVTTYGAGVRLYFDK
ncbi:MAG: outer membrane beta-barrel protein [Proteobacteria bacterium]|nr:outer membrane beta-barrel protein [Pseudomonadota bacterium]